MKRDGSIKLLRKHISQSKKAAVWLTKSIQKCHSIDLDVKLTEPQFDVLENLTSRFARLSDILVQKLFRLLDQIELESTGTTIDVLNRAAKRGFLDDETLRKIREIRNAVAHEYTEEELVNTFKEVKRLAPLLLEIQGKTESYVIRYIERALAAAKPGK